MRTILTLLFVILLTTEVHSQVVFEPAYFITNSGEKVQCLIKNHDPENTPQSFEYKHSDESAVEFGKAEHVKEFGFINGPVYKKFTIQLDHSSYDMNQFDNKIKEIGQAEQLFIKQLVEGQADLYEYVHQSFKTYFYSINDTSVVQLIYREWLEGNTIKKNQLFRQQLYTTLSHNDLSLANFERLRYNRKELIRLFSTYNGPQHNLVNATNKKRRYFSLSGHVGYQTGTLKVEGPNASFDFSNLSSISLGGEVEYFLSVNKNKWSFFTAPTYFTLSSKQAINYYTNAAIDYKCLDVPVGLRHSFYLATENRFYLSLAYVLTYSFNSQLIYGYEHNLDITTYPSYLFGIGYNRRRLRAELKYGMKREVLQTYHYWSSNLDFVNISLGYSIWKK